MNPIGAPANRQPSPTWLSNRNVGWISAAHPPSTTTYAATSGHRPDTLFSPSPSQRPRDSKRLTPFTRLSP
jgi:hypothetical protein